MKWTDYDGMSCVICEDDEIAERLEDLSARMFVGLNGSGYARCDLRLDAHGTPQMLEINPNCGVFYEPKDAGSADFILLNDPGGHRAFLDTIMRAGIKRQSRRRKPWIIRTDRSGNAHTEARVAIPEGALIEPFEERAQWLVTKSHQERNWDLREKDWFARYAWPLTDEVYVAWSKDPSDWKPINHSCNPNAWLNGLDVVARRAIAPGEEITLDYATFYNENMPSFACSCGASDCRGTIRGTDYLEPFVERYGEHISDYVRRRRAEAAATRLGLAPPEPSPL
jgi:D-alanine-D-alanine ligase